MTTLPPSLEDIEALALAARLTLPEPFGAAATQVPVRVVDWPEDDLLDELDLDDPYELTGLFEGTPLTEVSLSAPPTRPNVIWLFRRPILDEWAARGDVTLDALVSHILIHELAHHFGWSDDDIAAVDRWWE